MAHRISIWVLTLCCAATVSFQSQAQTPAAKENPSRETSKTKGLSNGQESAAIEQVRRESAVSIIRSLVEESERYHDQTLRVRTQARAADALWSVDETVARGLFLRAWRTAEKVDEEGEQTAKEARKSALSKRGSGLTMIPAATSLRSEILRLAARRDPALGEILLAKLDEAKEQKDGSSDQKNALSESFDPTEPSLAIAKRLEVALQLLNTGDVKQAKAFADPALVYTTSPGIIFLCALRQKDPQGADELYARLLALAANDPAAEATTVSLLSSYAFTPAVLVTVTRRGRVSNQFGDTAQSYELSPGLRASFLNVAAAVLLRPPPPLDQDISLAGRAGTYFTIARLLPLFARYAANYVPALNAQLALLTPDAPETFRDGRESMLRLGLGQDGSNKDTLPEILNQVAGAANSAERDALYVKAIRAGVTNGDPRIRELADKIEDETLRERARAFADLVLVRSALSKRNVDEALRLAHAGHLSPLHHVWALAGIARLLIKPDPARATELLDNAATEANSIGLGEADRVYALTCVSAAFFLVDHSRSWNLASDAIKAANAVPGFTGEDAKLSASLRTKNIISMISSDENSFNIVSLFDLLSRDDVQLAISLANNLKEETPRAATTLAIANSVLRQETHAASSRR